MIGVLCFLIHSYINTGVLACQHQNARFLKKCADPDNQPKYPACKDTVEDDRSGDGEYFAADTKYLSLPFCQDRDKNYINSFLKLLEKSFCNISVGLAFSYKIRYTTSHIGISTPYALLKLCNAFTV